MQTADTRRALLVDAFTDTPLAGNAAGVVPDAAGLSEAQMQAVARELGASETAFLRPSEPADRRVRYFTPGQEVDLCGHATIASHAMLHADGVLEPGVHSLETNVGVLEIEVAGDGTVWMTQDDPAVRDLSADLSLERVAEALGVDVAALQDIGQDLPVARATTGLPFVVVPVNFLSHLGEMAPDMGAVEALTEAFDAAGVYAFTFDTLGPDTTLHARMFAPGAGVPEDPVTGTASGACGAYLRRFDAFDTLPDELRFEQGHFVDRPGEVRVRVGSGPATDREGDPTDTVRVGGRAVVSLDGELGVPELGEDEIVEA